MTRYGKLVNVNFNNGKLNLYEIKDVELNDFMGIDAFEIVEKYAPKLDSKASTKCSSVYYAVSTVEFSNGGGDYRIAVVKENAFKRYKKEFIAEVVYFAMDI